MTCGERLKLVRKNSGLTLDKFGARVGVTKAAVSRLENDINSMTEQMFKSVCREFNVSEEWLRTGEGEMLKPVSRSEAIARFAGELMKEEDSSFKKQFIEVLVELDESEWETLKNIALKLVNKGTHDEPSGNFEQFPKTPEELEEKYPPIEEEGKKKRSS